jgi:hypothetical protein
VMTVPIACRPPFEACTILSSNGTIGEPQRDSVDD